MSKTEIDHTQTVSSIIATWEQQATLRKEKPESEPLPEPLSAVGTIIPLPKRPHPLRTVWQRKWLDLDVFDPRLQAVADEIQDYAKRLHRWDHSRPLLVIFGPPGNGKTHIAKRLHSWAMHVAMNIYDTNKLKCSSIPSVLWRYWPRVVDGLKEGRYEIVDDLLEEDIIFIDDLGSEHDPSKNGVDKLCQIINRRERKFSVFTTNLSPEAWEDKWDLRVADRLLRYSQIVDLSEIPSYWVTRRLEGNP